MESGKESRSQRQRKAGKGGGSREQILPGRRGREWECSAGRGGRDMPETMRVQEGTKERGNRGGGC